METAKDAFYHKLQNDYRLVGTDSVIYRFIQEEQERLYQQFKNGSPAQKGSSLIQLRLHFDALTAGKESPMEYIENLLHILSSRPIHVEVKAFFYDAGYRLNNKSYGDIREADAGE